MRKRIFSLLLISGFLLLGFFLAFFFFQMSQPGYWHFMDMGAYLSRSVFAIEHGFFQEVPYWNYGYGYVSFEIYPPLFFAAVSAVFHALFLFGLESVYWSFFAAFLLSYVFAFALTWKISRKGALAYLLAAGNIFALGLLVLIGFSTKIFAFNLCFPALVFLLKKRNGLEVGKRELAAFSLLLPALFAAHPFVFAFFSVFYLSVAACNNRKVLLRALTPFAFVPLLTAPYFLSFFSSLASAAGQGAGGALAFNLNFYTAVFILFIALFLLTREKALAPLALLSFLFAFNLHSFLPGFGSVGTPVAAMLFLGIICYYAVARPLTAIARFSSKRLGGMGREHALFALLFLILFLNFPYFQPRIEKANLFNNSEYKPLLEFGELPGVFFAADLEGKDRFISPFVSYQTFRFRNYSVNDWLPMGEAHERFAGDREALVEAFREGNCSRVHSLVEKMQVTTLALKNISPGSYCGLELEADLGAFKVLAREDTT